MKNPKPKEAKVWDYFEHPDGYKRKHITNMVWDIAHYATYFRIDKTDEYEYEPTCDWHCSLSHLRRWSKDWAR